MTTGGVQNIYKETNSNNTESCPKETQTTTKSQRELRNQFKAKQNGTKTQNDHKDTQITTDTK